MMSLTIIKEKKQWIVLHREVDDEVPLKYTCSNYEEVVGTINTLLQANHPNQTRLGDFRGEAQ